MQSCLVCGAETLVIVNINFKATPVCDRCCLLITKQTVSSLTVASLMIPFEEERPETVQTCYGEFVVGGEG